MLSCEPALPRGLIQSVFLARARMYSASLVAAVALTISEGTVRALLFVVAGTALAWWQRRSLSLARAFLVDLVVACALAYDGFTPLGVTLMVGWSAVMGLVDLSRSWRHPLVVGVAGFVVSAIVPAGAPADRSGLAHLLAAVAVGGVASSFEVVFRSVGDILRRREAELRSFFDRVPVALVRTRATGELLEYNRAMVDMFEESTLKAGQITDIYVDTARRGELVATLLERGSVHDFPIQLKGCHDRVLHTLVAANAVSDEFGSLRFIESAILDITALHDAVHERERLARVIDSTSDLVAIADHEGAIVYANPAAREWLRRYVTDDECVHLSQPLSNEDLSRLRRVVLRDGLFTGQVTTLGRVGHRIVSITVQLLDDGGAPGFAAIARDVTEDIDTARRLERLVKAKDEFVASVSHEIRTPLAAVLGLATELRDHRSDFDPGTEEELVGVIAEQAQEVANIVEDLLVAARVDTESIVLSIGEVDLAAAVDRALRAIPQMGLSAEIASTVGGRCRGDAPRIRQILRNLLSNAIRYGGANITLSTRMDGDRVCLDVVDDGPGVPADRAESIFQPFERAHVVGTQPASVGLGLSVSRDLARRMGGDVTYTRIGDRSVFTLALPASTAEAPETQVA